MMNTPLAVLTPHKIHLREHIPCLTRHSVCLAIQPALKLSLGPQSAVERPVGWRMESPFAAAVLGLIERRGKS